MENLSIISRMMRCIAWLGMSLLLLWSACSCGQQKVEEHLLPIVQKALNDTSSVYYADFSHFPEDYASLSIGIFDDDLSQFNVLEAFLTADNFNNITGAEGADGICDFAGEHFAYLADGANASYDVYLQRGNLDFLKETVVRNALFLLGDSYYNLALDEQPYGLKSRSKLLVCANATASAYGGQDVVTMLGQTRTKIPVVNLIDAAAGAFLKKVQDQGEAAVGILADPFVDDVAYYENAIRQKAAQMDFAGKIRFHNQKTFGVSEMMAPVQGTSMLFDAAMGESQLGQQHPLPELGFGEGKIDITLMDRYNFDFTNGAMVYRLQNGFYTELKINSAENLMRYYLVSLMEKYRKQENPYPLKAILLACPYASALRPVLEETLTTLREYKRNGVYLYHDVIAEDFCFIDPAQEVTRMTYELLREQHRLALRGTASEIETYVSMPTYGTPMEALTPIGLFTEDYRYTRRSGTEIITTKPVPLAYRYLSLTDLEQLQRVAPTAYKLIVNQLY